MLLALQPSEGKGAKCVFTRSTRPAQPQLSPNLVLPSFSGLAGKYRFSRYSRRVIYLIKCVFWHVRYLPDGLTAGKEQMLSFVQIVTLVAGCESSVLSLPFHGGKASARVAGLGQRWGSARSQQQAMPVVPSPTARGCDVCGELCHAVSLLGRMGLPKFTCFATIGHCPQLCASSVSGAGCLILVNVSLGAAPGQ